jgi:hypothetical protein
MEVKDRGRGGRGGRGEKQREAQRGCARGGTRLRTPAVAGPPARLLRHVIGT